MSSADLAATLRLWRLAGGPGPGVALTWRVGRAARAAAMRVQAARTGDARLPDCLHGPAAPGAQHAHAFWQGEDRDGDGRIDHLAVRVPGGLDAEGAAVLNALEEIAVDGAGRRRLVPVAPGPEEARSHRRWISAVPFYGPRHALDARGRPRAGEGLAEQLVRELGWLPWLPPVAEVHLLPHEGPGIVPPWAYDLGPRRQGAPALRVAGRVIVTFAGPARPPVAAGHGAHFGLGRFAPLPEVPEA